MKLCSIPLVAKLLLTVDKKSTTYRMRTRIFIMVDVTEGTYEIAHLSHFASNESR